MRPAPPHPDRVRQPKRGFGWLDGRLLHDGWLERLGLEGIAVLVLLAVAADQHGASWYRRERMGMRLGLPREQVDAGLAQLQRLGLLAHRPWTPGNPDGVWQLLDVPRSLPARTGSTEGLRSLIGKLMVRPPE